MISQDFKNALKVFPTSKHLLAWKAGISPGVLNHLINGHQRVKPGDERLLRVARLIKFPEDRVFVKGEKIT